MVEDIHLKAHHLAFFECPKTAEGTQLGEKAKFYTLVYFIEYLP